MWWKASAPAAAKSKYQNREIRDELWENIDGRLTVDDFSQYAPMVAAKGLCCTFASPILLKKGEI